jgi:hypothetical protein
MGKIMASAVALEIGADLRSYGCDQGLHG